MFGWGEDIDPPWNSGSELGYIFIYILCLSGSDGQPRLIKVDSSIHPSINLVLQQLSSQHPPPPPSLPPTIYYQDIMPPTVSLLQCYNSCIDDEFRVWLTTVCWHSCYIDMDPWRCRSNCWHWKESFFFVIIKTEKIAIYLLLAAPLSRCQSR